MFGLFKKQVTTPKENIQYVFDVVKVFGDLITKIDALAFYDVACLPYKKDEIRKCIFLAYMLKKDKDYRGFLSGALVCLASFQKGIGVEPIRIISTDVWQAYSAGELSKDSLLHMMASDRVGCNSAAYETFRKLADVEVQEDIKTLALIAASEGK